MPGEGTRNVGIRGRVLDASGAPLAGLVVRAWDQDLLARDDLGETTTDERGAFLLRYRPGAYGPIERRPDLVVAVLDPLGVRPLATRGPFASVEDEVLDVGDFAVARADVAGLAATLGRDAPERLSTGNAVELLADEAQFEALVAAIRGAKRSVHLLQFLWEPRFQALFPGHRGERPLVEELADAARRGVAVRVMVNENTFWPDDVDEIRREVERGGPSAEVRGFPVGANVMHAKILVVDDVEAMVLGPIFFQKSWDSSAHHGRDPRRGTDRPTHDLSLRARGPVVRDLAAVFALHWNEAGARTGGPLLATPPAPPPAGRESAQVVLTLPRLVFREHPQGERGILESYQRGLASAERLVYLENQYFTSGTISHALHRLLHARKDLEVILVANDEVDVPFYNRWQRRSVARLHYPEHPRLGVFVLAEPTPGDPKRPVAPVYVHSKLAVVDDRWATLGTANLDDFSLEPFPSLGGTLDSNIDVNVTLFDGVEGHPRTGVAGAIRRRLWAEHLGMPLEDVASRPEGAWLSVWRRTAEANARALREGRPQDFRGRVLPFVPDAPLTRGFSREGPG